MANSSDYSSHLSTEAVAFVLSLSPAKQRKVLDIADRIASAPHGISDHSTSDAQGRPIENLLVDEFHFSYWIDHATREVRIVEIILV